MPADPALWHATYNAAITGLSSRMEAVDLDFRDDELPGGSSNRREHNAAVLELLEHIDRAARNIATKAHGVLPP